MNNFKSTEPILKIENLCTYFFTRDSTVRAVDDVSIEVFEGESVGLVGESGSGKSQTALSIMGLVEPPGRIVSGRISFLDKNLLTETKENLRKIRGKDLAMIFQDALSSLNPSIRVGDQIAEVLRVHRAGRNRFAVISDEILGLHRLRKFTREIKEKVISLFQIVRIPEASQRTQSHPHQFSGGLRQRVMIATGLSWNPALLIADEPTTALDVTVEAQVLGLIRELQDEMNMGLLLVTHDFGLIAENCDRVYVMYAGQIVEEAKVKTLFQEPLHPYTRGLLAATLDLDDQRQQDQSLPSMEGAMPDLTEPFPGCAFYERCTHRLDPRCVSERPPLRAIDESHKVACFYDGPAGL